VKPILYMRLFLEDFYQHLIAGEDPFSDRLSNSVDRRKDPLIGSFFRPLNLRVSEIDPNQMIPDEDLATLRFSPRIFTKTFLGGLALYRSTKGSFDLFSSY
jgi:hypothetical protein